MSDNAKTAAAAAPQADVDRICAEIHRVGDAVFGLKNAVAAGTAVSNAILLAMEGSFQPGAGGAVTVTVPPASTIPPATQTPASAVIAAGQANMSVGATRTIKEPADALQYLAPGGVITLDNGTYIKPFHNTVAGLVLQSDTGMPRLCKFDGQGGHGAGHDMAYHKGMIHSGLAITVRRIGFERCGDIMGTDAYSNEAAIWLGDSGGQNPSPVTQLWTANIIECTFDDNANAIFTSDEPGLILNASGSIFGMMKPNGMNACAAGLADHAAHDIYSHAGETNASGNFFFGGPGHAVKTRGAKTNVHDNPVMCQDGGRVLDACEGGNVLFTGNSVWTRTDRQGVMIGQNRGAFGNANTLEYALENTNHGTPGALLSNNVFHISRSNSTIAAGNGGTITSIGDVVNTYGSGNLVTQGTVVGAAAPIAQPGNPPAFPPVPAWALAA